MDFFMERLKCYDVVKFMAILMVCVTHFVAIFNPYFFYLWKTYPTKFVLDGVTGKLGVCILGVVMCYFAYKSKETNPIRYFFKRYFYFVVSGGGNKCSICTTWYRKLLNGKNIH